MAILTFANPELINSRSLISRGFVEPDRTLNGGARKWVLFSALKTSMPSIELVRDEVTLEFFKDRQLNGDFVTRVYDVLQKRSNLNLEELDSNKEIETAQLYDNTIEEDTDGAFSRLSTTRDLDSASNNAPQIKKLTWEDRQNQRERLKKLNFLQYEALKGELLFLTCGVGAACTIYCVLAISFQAAISYAIGVLFSCLYLRLLYNHADSISREAIPEIFMIAKRKKKIGITSDDLRDSLKKLTSGITLSLASPRLVIPASIYGLWAFSQHFHNDFFDFQIVPGVMGFLAYKGAALVQAYRDNEDLRLILPDNQESDLN